MNGLMWCNMNYTPMFVICNKGININNARWHSARNPDDNHAYWQYENVWFVRVALRPRLWEKRYTSSSSQHYTSVTVLGVEFGHGYYHQSEKIL
jgi:hypothetical protein